jgi:hypothetical protein
VPTTSAATTRRIAAVIATPTGKANRADTARDAAQATVSRPFTAAHAPRREPIPPAEMRRTARRATRNLRAMASTVIGGTRGKRRRSSTAGRAGNHAPPDAGPHARAAASTDRAQARRAFFRPSQGRHDVTRVYNWPTLTPPILTPK